jgi:hypothetical protein
MKKPALRRATKSTVIFVVALLLFAAGLAGTTFAYFDGEADNVATWSGGYVFPPTLAAVVGSPVGRAQTITWTTPTTTGIQNYVLRATNMGTTVAAACPAQVTTTVAVTSTTFTPIVSPTTTQIATQTIGTVTLPTTYPETVATLAAPAQTGVATVTTTESGDYVCYQVAGYWSAGTWYSKNVNANATATRAGLWPTAVAKTNGNGSTTSLGNGDKLAITYNQSVSVSTGTVQVCASTTAIVVGNGSGCSGSIVGQLTGMTIGTARNFPTSTISASGTVVTVTLGGATAASTISGTGQWKGGNGIVQTSASPQVAGCSTTDTTAATWCKVSAGTSGF